MIIDKNIQKNFFVLIFPIVLVLPLPLLCGSISLALLCLNLLVKSTKQELLDNLRSVHSRFFIFLLASVFLLDALLSFFSEGKFEVSFKEVRLPFFILPFVVSITKSKFRNIREQILFSTVLGTLFYILYADIYLLYFYNYVANVDFALDHFLKYNFTNVPGAYHHTYQGLYMLFSILILLYAEPVNVRMNRKIISAIIIIILSHMFFMASKLTLALGLIFVLGTSFKYLLKKRKYRKSIIGVFLVLCLILSAALIKSVSFSTLAFSLNNRLDSWKCSLELFCENPFFGTDEGTIYDYLKNCVQSYAVSTHNQLFDEILNYGIFALWLPVFYYILFFASKNKRLFRSLVYVILIVSLFENILSVQRGVLFVIFYCSLFYFCPQNPKPYLNNE